MAILQLTQAHGQDLPTIKYYRLPKNVKFVMCELFPINSDKLLKSTYSVLLPITDGLHNASTFLKLP